MKALLIRTIIILLGITASLNAQNKTEIEILRARFNAEKVDLISYFMGFTEEEGELFWPIYKEYEREHSQISDNRIKLLQQYVNYYEDLTSDQAQFWVKEVFKMQQQEMDLNKKYYKKFAKALTPQFSLRFYQFESALQIEIRNEIMKNLPLLENY
ncbi:hypothetical protein [Flavivirga eckloniae]|nr:hypothetical protein [Flavivirga eckloniae]